MPVVSQPSYATRVLLSAMIHLVEAVYGVTSLSHGQNTDPTKPNTDATTRMSQLARTI